MERNGLERTGAKRNVTEVKGSDRRGNKWIGPDRIVKDWTVGDRRAGEGTGRESMGLLDKYPIDVSDLHKGQILTNERLAELTGLKVSDGQKWALAILGLSAFIQDKTDFTVRISSDGLHVLTDSEAASYNHRRFGINLRGALRRYERNTKVDQENLSPEEQAIHARNLISESRYVSAIGEVTRRVSIAAHKNNDPPMIQE